MSKQISAGLAFLVGLIVACGLTTLDRAHWYDRYGQELQVQHCTKGDRK